MFSPAVDFSPGSLCGSILSDENAREEVVIYDGAMFKSPINTGQLLEGHIKTLTLSFTVVEALVHFNE